MMYTIPLIRLNQYLECTHSFLHANIHPMKLYSFVDIIYQGPVDVLSDAIEYQCALCTGI